jgi:hypothetical protein
MATVGASKLEELKAKRERCAARLARLDDLIEQEAQAPTEVRCKGTLKHWKPGQPCSFRATRGEYCYHHDPQNVGVRGANQKKWHGCMALKANGEICPAGVSDPVGLCVAHTQMLVRHKTKIEWVKNEAGGNVMGRKWCEICGGESPDYWGTCPGKASLREQMQERVKEYLEAHKA